jgi:predicted membrane channel-forming protein YqfA (hemolysin III family)
MAQSINVRNFTKFSLVAAVANSVIYLVAKSSDATMVVNQGGSREISAFMVFGATIFGLLVASYVANFIGKKSEGFISKSPMIGLVFGIVTAVAPFTASDDSKTAIALASNHIVAGVIWYFGAKRSIN